MFKCRTYFPVLIKQLGRWEQLLLGQGAKFPLTGMHSHRHQLVTSPISAHSSWRTVTHSTPPHHHPTTSWQIRGERQRLAHNGKPVIKSGQWSDSNLACKHRTLLLPAPTVTSSTIKTFTTHLLIHTQTHIQSCCVYKIRHEDATGNVLV